MRRADVRDGDGIAAPFAGQPRRVQELRELVTVGLKPAQLVTLYDKMCDFTDVQFPAPQHPRPRDRRRRLPARLPLFLAP